mgnify:CR=1 FL=1
MLGELKNFLDAILKWLIGLVLLASIFFFLGWAASFFTMIREDLVPVEVKLMTTNPFDAFLAEIKVAFFLALVFLLPALLWSLLRYLSPALKQRERQALYRVVIPAAALFFAGCFFAYRLIIPATISLLYSYTDRIGAAAFFAVSDFVSLTLAFMLVTGLIFLLPIFMFLSSVSDLIKAQFWLAHWRQAILVFVVGAAVITPDGTGITMILLLVPLCFLYALGLLASQWYNRGVA